MTTAATTSPKMIVLTMTTTATASPMMIVLTMTTTATASPKMIVLTEAMMITTIVVIGVGLTPTILLITRMIIRMAITVVATMAMITTTVVIGVGSMTTIILIGPVIGISKHHGNNLHCFFNFIWHYPISRFLIS